MNTELTQRETPGTFLGVSLHNEKMLYFTLLATATLRNESKIDYSAI